MRAGISGKGAEKYIVREIGLTRPCKTSRTRLEYTVHSVLLLTSAGAIVMRCAWAAVLNGNFGSGDRARAELRGGNARTSPGLN